MAMSEMMTKYLQTKEQYKDCIVFYRLGDFYEMFFEDAVLASKVLELTLTGRSCGLEERAPMCGIPYHASEVYIKKLIDNGYKVAICEQLTEPKAGELVKRDVIRVVTPGTVFEDSMLDEKRNNYLMAISQIKNEYGVAYCDVSTGEFFTDEVKGARAETLLNDIIVRISPAEIICKEETKDVILNTTAYKMGAISKPFVELDWTFGLEKASDSIRSQFSASALNVFELSENPLAISSCGALLIYLGNTQKRSLIHIKKIQKVKNSDYMTLDISTRRNLELTETIRDRRKKGSILWLLDNTKTSMGARLFRKWIDEPLYNEKKINNRLEAVEELVKNNIIREKLSGALSKIRDIERLCGKLAFGSINPRDCLALGQSLSLIPDVKNAIYGLKSNLMQEINADIKDYSDVETLLLSAISPDAPMLLKDGGYIKEGYNKTLDELRSAQINGKNWIAKLEATEREKTGIKNLKISFNRVFGYYIEVNKSQTSLVPLTYVRRQTVANNERYIFEELKEIENKILGAEENSIKLEAELFKGLKNTLVSILPHLQTLASRLAELDCLLSLSICAVKYNYTKPKINKTGKFEIVEGRHPVVEATIHDGTFIPNDTDLDLHDNKIMIITGPNMAGKSTYMRQVAVICYMAHIGCFVPARSANISLCDRIFTRVGASDDLAFGQSTFMVEMSEVAVILANATNNSLVILDEIGRGTSTFDGLSIAYAVVESLAKKYNTKTLFATHYHELTELEGTLEGVKNYRIQIKEFNNQIIFLRKIVRGGANRSFGIEVASLAGLPLDIIDRAKSISNSLEEADLNKHLSINDAVKNASVSVVKERKNLLEIERVLKDLKIERITPLEALDLLNTLSALVKKEN